MTESTLGFHIDSGNLEEGVKKLDDVTASSKKAEDAAAALERSFASLESTLNKINASVMAVERAVKSVNTAIASSATANNKAEQSANGLSSSFASLNTTLAKIDASVGAVEAAVKSSGAANNKTEQSTHSLDAAFAALNTTLNKVNTSIGSVEKRIEETNMSVKQLNQSTRQAGATTQEISTKLDTLGNSAQGAGQKIDKMNPGGSGGALALVTKGVGALAAAFVSLETLQSGLRAVKAVNDIADTATRLGVSTAQLQEFSAAVRVSGGTAEAAYSAYDNFVTAVGKAAEGEGYLAQLFKANNVALNGHNGEMRSSAELMREFIALIEGVGSKAEKLRLIYKVLGTGVSSDVVNALLAGADGFDQLTEKGREFGMVLSDDTIAKAQELQTKFNLVQQAATSAFQKASIWAFDHLVPALERVGDMLKEDLALFYQLKGIFSTLGTWDFESLANGRNTAIAKFKAGIGSTLTPDQSQEFDKAFGSSQPQPPTTTPTITPGKGSDLYDKAVEGAQRFIETQNQAIASIGKGDEALRAFKYTADLVKQATREGLIKISPDQLKFLEDLGKKMAEAETQAKAADYTYKTIQSMNQAAAQMSQGLAQALGMSEQAALAYRYEQEALNRAIEQNIKLTTDQIAAIRAAAQARAAAEFVNKGIDLTISTVKSNQAAVRQQQQAINALGMGAQEAAAYRYEQEALNRAIEQGIQLTPAQVAAIKSSAQARAAAEYQFKSAEYAVNSVKSAEMFIRQQQQTIAALGMSEQAASAYRYEQEMLNRAIEQGIQLSPAQAAAIHNAAQAMAAAEQAAKNAKEAFDLTKDSVRGFLGDMISGLQEGKNAWEALGTAAQNVLNKIMNKLLDQVSDQIARALMPSLFGGTAQAGSGGLLGPLMTSIAGTGSARAVSIPNSGVATSPITTAGISTNAPVFNGAINVQGGVQSLFDARSKFAGELSNPQTMNKLFANVQAEVGGQGPVAQQAYMESVFNRAWARNQTLDQTISDPRYYPQSTRDNMSRYMAKGPNDYSPQLSNVMGGSNISNWATGNASGTAGFAGGPQTFAAGGERFGIEGPDRARIAGLQSLDTSAKATANSTQQMGTAATATGQSTQQLGTSAQAAGQSTQQMGTQVGSSGQQASSGLDQVGNSSQRAAQNQQMNTTAVGQATGTTQTFASGLTSGLSQITNGIGSLLSNIGGGAGGIVSGIFSMFKLAGGGRVSGPGGPTADKIPALLSDNEFVVNAAQTKKYLPLLQAVNDNSLPDIIRRSQDKAALASNDNWQPLRLASGGYVGGVTAAMRGYSGGGIVAPEARYMPTVAYSPQAQQAPQVNNTVNVIGADSNTQVRQTDDGNGNIRTDVILDKAVAQNMGKTGSKTQNMMKTQFGATKATAKL